MLKFLYIFYLAQRVNLDKGSYIFKDLNNSTNVQMILEKRNLFSGKYSTICRLGHAFTIKHHTQIIVAIGVETGIEYKDFVVLPVIYKEG